jgi:hypothetical protein
MSRESAAPAIGDEAAVLRTYAATMPRATCAQSFSRPSESAGEEAKIDVLALKRNGSADNTHAQDVLHAERGAVQRSDAAYCEGPKMATHHERTIMGRGSAQR